MVRKVIILILLSYASFCRCQQQCVKQRHVIVHASWNTRIAQHRENSLWRNVARCMTQLVRVGTSVRKTKIRRVSCRCKLMQPTAHFYPPINLLTRVPLGGHDQLVPPAALWWRLDLLTDAGLRNDPITAELGKQCWTINVSADVTPRDVLDAIGLDASANVGLYTQQCTRWENRPGFDYIFILPNGPAMAMDEPLVASLRPGVAPGARLRIHVLGALVFTSQNEGDNLQEEEAESDGCESNHDGNEELFVYVLECANGKYYVGKTKYPRFRIEDHFDAQACKCALLWNIVQLTVCSGMDEEVPSSACRPSDRRRQPTRWVQVHAEVHGAPWRW